jgi:hypothetical protein
MSLSLITLELVLRNILQNCGRPIHQNHHTTPTQPLPAAYTFPLSHPLPPLIRALPCLHCRGEKGKP